MTTQLNTWVDIPTDSDFSIYNLPYGIFSSHQNQIKRAGVALGNYVIDLNALLQLGYFNTISQKLSGTFNRPQLNDFIELGKEVHTAIRTQLQAIFTDFALKDILSSSCSNVLTPAENCTIFLPIIVRDYTDFYSSEQHARNVGTMFRDPANALLPNWKHMPIAYHGRASSIVVSGTTITRPNGQTKTPDVSEPSFGPTKALDFELEVACIIGKATSLGSTLSVNEAEGYVFGYVLFNDWSARDIQTWEYVPLGPFLAKNFGSSISPWIVTTQALEPFQILETQPQMPTVLPYLTQETRVQYDINLEVQLLPKGDNLTPTSISKSNFKYMYWSVAQQLAHHTSNGCNLNVGDICASGTISGPTKDSYGSMLELTWRGTKPLKLNDGQDRKFIEDYDTVIMKGFAAKDGIRVGFGQVSGQILPAKENNKI